MTGWTALEPVVDTFLAEFDRRGEGAGVAELFAEHFMALDPARALPLTREQLAAALPARRRMFAATGLGRLERVAATQLRLDGRHVLVRARWRSGSRPALALESSFLLRDGDDGFRIAVYLNHADIATELERTADA